MEQHFLTRPEKLIALVEAAGIAPTDRVLELGSGGGTVAAALPPCALTLVELDARLAAGLRARFPGAVVLQADALGVLGRTDADIILANLPYALTDAVLGRLGEKTFRRALIAVHEGDDVVRLERVAGGRLRLEPLFTLAGDDFTPPQPFGSRIVRVTRG